MQIFFIILKLREIKMAEKLKMMDGNEAAASIAHRLNEVIAIYPITPSSNMGELSDAWATGGMTNIWGKIPEVWEMQSEAGAIGAVHGALQSGAYSTTFTASQGLLLMIPSMFKIAGELTPFVMHVAARTVAANALSIFGDHSDVMSCRQTGFAMLASNSVQEAHDMAAIAQHASIVSRLPFVHFFDGFRTSHEINKINYIDDETLLAMMDDVDLNAHRDRGLTPDAPVIRGTAQNPDVFFQVREGINSFYDKGVDIVQKSMDKFAKLTGREYNVVDYVGAEDAEKVIVIMGSGAETVEETVKFLASKGEKVGVLKVRLYRPFPAKQFIDALPSSVKTLTVLDRTKEPGSMGEPLYLDVIAALTEAVTDATISGMPKVLRGRYGLSSKEFTPAMVKAVYDNTAKKIFTVGIEDDVTELSLDYDHGFDIEPDDIVRAVFFGLGSDGTVGANKNSIKIIADDGNRYGQAYFVYDSKKSGAMTTSHLRFSEHPIKAAYLIHKADFVACHHHPFMEKLDILDMAKTGAVFLMNSPYAPDAVWDSLPIEVQQQIIDKKIKFYNIDAVSVAEKTGMGRRVNTIMQTCFFAISGVLPKDEAITKIKEAIDKTYSKKSKEIVQKNFAAVDAALDSLHEIKVPASATSSHKRLPGMPENAPEFVQKVEGKIIEGKGDSLKVSDFMPVVDGTWPTDTAKHEKRKIATQIPCWDKDVCIQCGKCALVCPHAAIRAKVAPNDVVKDAPADFKMADYKGKELPDCKFMIQVAPEDCTGCTLCNQVCPAKSKENPEHKAIDMRPLNDEVLAEEIPNFDYFLSLPETDRSKVDTKMVKSAMLLQPLFEFSGACAGCGETQYIKLITQLFGDRTIIANATGCSSIYGGNLPTTPYAKNADGRGPAWANSLFEDNAEFGLGMRFAADYQANFAKQLLSELEKDIGGDLVDNLMKADQSTEAGINEQRDRVKALKDKLASVKSEKAKLLLGVADYLVKKSVWIVGGDGWAYDIGFGGLDHVLHSGQNVNILVMDTGVYSNTGGQQSKATPIGAIAKFAAAGRELPRKDLGMIAMATRHAYVASVALGANDAQVLKAFNEAESFDGPSIIIAYSHCIAHGFDLAKGLEHQKIAVESGLWPLFRYDPRITDKAKLQLDSKAASRSVADFMRLETRFKAVEAMDPERFNMFCEKSDKEIKAKRKYYEAFVTASSPDTTETEETK